MSWTQPSLIKKGKGSAESKFFQIRILYLDSIAIYPSEVLGSVALSGNYLLKDGHYFTDLQVTSSKTSLPTTGEGEEDNISLSSLPEFYYPGSSIDIENFIENSLNRGMIVFQKIGSCGDENAYWKQFGSCAAPLTLMPEGTNNNDGTGYLLKFQQFAKTDKMPKRYYGTFTLDTATTVAADATTVDVTNGDGEYQLTDNTAATIITDLTNASNNGKYTLIGSGGSNPATIEATNANFVLVGGVDWQGLSGSTITFNAIDAGGGDHVFIETNRT